MTRMRKKMENLMNNQKDVKWSELKVVLEYCGCEIREGKGSHKVVYHPKSHQNITIAVHNNGVKVIYVKRCLKLLEEVLEEEGG